jgi:hypothetical protein
MPVKEVTGEKSPKAEERDLKMIWFFLPCSSN